MKKIKKEMKDNKYLKEINNMIIQIQFIIQSFKILKQYKIY